MLMLVASCNSQSTTDSKPTVVVDTACTSFSPIYTYGNDSEVMDIRTVREINAHNDIWDKLCGGSNEPAK